jgi:serine/threonine protein kinase
MRKAIGVGSFGCVYRPPLKCEKNKPSDGYANKISKLLQHHHSIIELNEYNKIVKIDKKKKYFLGKPYLCKADKQDVLNSVNTDDCDIFDESEIDNYDLLISKDGGMDLDDFLEKEMKSYIESDSSKTAVERFLLNIHNLLLGIKLFNDNDITHFDIKPSNIVFDKKTEKLMFIDFGLMDNISNVKSGIIDGLQKTNIHWSYPLEYGFLKTGTYLSYDELKTQSDVNSVIQFLQKVFSKTSSSSISTKGLLNSKKEEIQKIKDKSRGFNNTFNYMNNLLNPLTNSDKMSMISATVNSVYAYKGRYEELLEKSIHTIDTYAIGFTINSVANELFKINAITHDQYLEIHSFCKQLFDFNVEARLGDHEIIILKYEELLEEIGVLTKLNVRFENHKAVKGSISTKTQNPNNTIISSSDKIIDYSLEKEDLIECPNGKEYNPVSRRCVKVCPAGKERTKKGRCVKSCKPGKERAKNGRCVKNKTQKTK